MERIGVLSHMRQWLEMILALALLTAVIATLWAIGRARLTADVYSRRLEAVCADYQRLCQDYNRAISRTAVTELRVSGNAVVVVIRTADGATREIPTACRPDREVYVDYVVVDGRLWIRRVFDSATTPEAGTLIDPALAGVPWEADATTVGKAVYRRLSDGRWVVTVSGNGSLGLERVAPTAHVVLTPPPAVNDYAAVQRELDLARTDITVLDLLRALVRSKPQPSNAAP